MPRIKPPRQEALAPKPELTPTDDVIINLDEAPIESTIVDINEPEPEVIAPVIKEPEVIAPAPDQDAVRRALEATNRADALQRQLADEQRRSQVREQELSRDRDEAQFNSILTSIAAEQNALDKAKGDYAAFMAAADWTNAAEAQSAMARAAARVDRLEDNKQTFEARREEVKRAPEPTQSPVQRSADQQIASLNVPDNAKTYLRQHPELVTDPAKLDRLTAVHNYVTKARGITEWSNDYFTALDRELGFAATTEEPAPTAPARRSMPVSAPVSRDPPTASGQRSNSNSVTLTPTEREVARNSFGSVRGAPDLTNAQKERLYAENKQRLNRMRASGEYRHTTEQTG